MDGSGVGGTGGGPLGGCATWACGAPMATEPSVAAGKQGSAFAMRLVADAKPLLSRSIARPGAPATVLMPLAMSCIAFVGRAGGWAGCAGGKTMRGLLMGRPTPLGALAARPVHRRACP